MPISEEARIALPRLSGSQTGEAQTSPPLPPSLALSAGIDWVGECAGEVQAKADVDYALASLLDGEAATNAPLIRALIERMEDRSTITLMSEGLAQLRGRARAAA